MNEPMTGHHLEQLAEAVARACAVEREAALNVLSCEQTYRVAEKARRNAEAEFSRAVEELMSDALTRS